MGWEGTPIYGKLGKLTWQYANRTQVVGIYIHSRLIVLWFPWQYRSNMSLFSWQGQPQNSLDCTAHQIFLIQSHQASKQFMVTTVLHSQHNPQLLQSNCYRAISLLKHHRLQSLLMDHPIHLFAQGHTSLSGAIQQLSLFLSILTNRMNCRP